MPLQTLVPAVVLWAWVAGGASGCGYCEKNSGEDSMTCPGATAGEDSYEVEGLLGRSLKLRCRSSNATVDYSRMSGCQFPSVTLVEFLGCPPPSLSYGEVMQKMGVNPKRVSNLTMSYPVDKGSLSDWHLKGVVGLRSLRMQGVSSVPNGLFKVTPKLEIIEIANGTVTHLPVDIFDNLTRLEFLRLQNNHLGELRSELFAGAPNLQAVHLQNNHIPELQENLFRGLKFLKTLNLGGNKLRFLNNIFPDNSAMESIDLSKNLLAGIGVRTFINQRKLKTLDLSSNELSSLPNAVFQQCTSLEKVWLNNNQLTHSDITDMFSSERNTVLTYLDLGHNNIIFPPDNWFAASFALHGQTRLKHLFLNNNNISAMPFAFNDVYLFLETLDLSWNSLEYLDYRSMIFIKSPVKLNLKYNHIKTISFIKSLPLSQEKELHLSLEGNPLKCDCQMYGFARIAQALPFLQVNNTMRITVEDSDKVSCLSSSGKLEYLMETQTDTLTCPVLETLEDNCTHHWRPHDQMLLTDCSHQDLKEIPQLNFTLNKSHLLTLILANNSLTTLSTLHLPPFTQLYNLTVPYNKLSSINVSHLPATLRVLDVRGNNLTNLPSPVLQYLNATDMNLKLKDNPWRCDCDLLDMISFLHVPSRKVDDFEVLQCHEDGTPLMSMSEHELCPFFLQPMVIVTIVAILIFLILFAVLGTVSFYKYKQGIKVWLFAHRMCLWAITEDELDADKKYDAFISYSHKDEDFVNKVLVPGLESGEPKYRVCLHYRDWVPGEYIQNQIMQSVEASRRTIVVLSSNFIESVWGQLEFRAAHSQALQDRTSRLIVIVYGKIPAESELDEKLQLYISTKTYVRWGDNKFWEKLRYIMPHPQELVRMRRRKRKDTDRLEFCKSGSNQSVC